MLTTYNQKGQIYMIIKLNDSYAIREQKRALGLLKKFKSNLPDNAIAIIAGGAPRDWHHGWGCRDIDIFLVCGNCLFAWWC